MNDLCFSFSYLEMSLRFKVSFFFDCFRISEEMGNEMAPYFMVKSKFYDRVLYLEWV